MLIFFLKQKRISPNIVEWKMLQYFGGKSKEQSKYLKEESQFFFLQKYHVYGLCMNPKKNISRQNILLPQEFYLAIFDPFVEEQAWRMEINTNKHKNLWVILFKGCKKKPNGS